MKTIFELIDDGNADEIRALLAAEPSARDLRNTGGISPLLYAAYRGLGPAFDAILEAGVPTDAWDRLVAGCGDGLPEPDAWTPDGFFTPLHLAAFVDNVPGATALLEAGADPNVLATASFARVTPLGTCAFSGALGVAPAVAQARRRSAHRRGRRVHGRGRSDRAGKRGAGTADRGSLGRSVAS